MIQLTTLKGNMFYLNPELIERIEQAHDTIITLVGGKKVRVSESAEEVTEDHGIQKGYSLLQLGGYRMKKNLIPFLS